MRIYCSIILLQISLIGAIDTSNSSIQFMAVNDCTCQGYNVTYECTVFGGGATVWKGTAFDCSLSDDEFLIFQTSQKVHTCNNGAITGRIVRAENDSYTSQLNVHISNDTGNNATVVCAHDTGTESIEIGSAILNITKVPFPPPTNVQLVEEDLTHLSFNWTHVSLSCPSIQYQIMASNCGECPNTTSNNMATCNGNYTQQMSKSPCSFAVQTVVCDNLVGDVSRSIAVTVTISTEYSGPNNSTKADSKEKNLHAESETIIRLIIPITVVLVLVLMGITLVLGLILVYLIVKRTKNITNQRTPGANMFEAADNNEQVQNLGIGVYSYLQSTEDQDQNPTSRTMDDITYTDLGPNTADRATHLTLLHDNRVQYEEIRHEAAIEVPVCGPQTSSQTLVNLDLLLILLKEVLTSRWYEFGLVIGVPKDVMDSYLGYPSDQCLTELLDYWLRHHPWPADMERGGSSPQGGQTLSVGRENSRNFYNRKVLTRGRHK